MSRPLDLRVKFYDSAEDATAALSERSRNLHGLRVETHHSSGKLFLARGYSGPSPSMQPKVFCMDRRWRGWGFCKFETDEAG